MGNEQNYRLLPEISSLKSLEDVSCRGVGQGLLLKLTILINRACERAEALMPSAREKYGICTSVLLPRKTLNSVFIIHSHISLGFRRCFADAFLELGGFLEIGSGLERSQEALVEILD
jgi:hypothetical protein